MSKNIEVLILYAESRQGQSFAAELSGRGFGVTLASGMASWAESGGRFDVVLLDMDQPCPDYTSLFKNLAHANPFAEVIVLSTEDSAAQAKNAVKAGAFDYLVKPVDPDMLAPILEEAGRCGRQRIEDAMYNVKEDQTDRQRFRSERQNAIGVLASGVAHEINNPLAIISLSTGWLEDCLSQDGSMHGTQKQDATSALLKIDQAVARIKKVTHQLLTFARENQWVAQKCDPADIACQVEGLARKAASENGVSIFNKAAPQSIEAFTDPAQLKQILLNLVFNAIQASSPGGTVEISLDDEGPVFVMQVRDDGEGILRQNMGRIFKPFFSTRPAGQGAGLGLCVARSMVERLGGSMEVESRFGRGSTFRAILPKTPEEPDYLISPSETRDNRAA